MAGPGFVHLHVHSSYSLLEGALTIARLAELAKADHQPALALTDTDNMFGALEFSEKLAGAGIQPIIGCALAVDFGDQEARPGLHAVEHGRIVLLAAREDGYRSLMRLNSRAFLETPPNEQPHLKLAWLEGETAGLIALTGGPGGPLDMAIVGGQDSLAHARCEALARLFGDRLYVELQRHGTAAERTAEPALIELAYARGIPLVATNEPLFATREDYEAHDALICIAEGRLVAETDRRQLTPEHRFKTPRRDGETVLRPAGGARLHGRDRAALLLSAAHAGADPAALLGRRRGRGGRRGGGTAQARRGRPRTAARRARPRARPHRRGVSRAARLRAQRHRGHEISGLLPDRRRTSSSGPRRRASRSGRAAARAPARSSPMRSPSPISIRCASTCLFERFLNPERVSMPDFDIDFCQDRRDEVIRYVQERYGRDQVAQIITFGTLQARGVLRDVGRVLQMPYGQVDKLCKLVPQNALNPVTLAQAIDDEPRLQAARDSDPVVAARLRHRQEARRPAPPRLDPRRRHRDRRAAARRDGAALSRSEIDDAGHPVQHEMGGAGGPGEVRLSRPQDADGAGDRGRAPAQARRSRSICPRSRSTTRRPTRMLSRAEAVGIFQLESQGMRRALLDMRPDRFEDIIALVALYRPGPMANIPTYCARKHGHGGAGIHPSQARADPARDLRRHHLSGTGDADRRRCCPATRSARPTCCAAPWARRSAPRWRSSAAVSCRAVSSAASRRTRPRRSSNCWSASPTTASTRAMPRPMRSSPIRPPI